MRPLFLPARSETKETGWKQAPARLLPTGKSFRFVFVGGTLERKGYDRLLKAYREEFGPEDDVCLVVKDLGTQTFYRYGNLKDQTLEARDDAHVPEIVYFEDDWTPGQLASLYTACDCLVMPYRGEGFGLPILEAMACGIPAIVPAGGASRDFVNEANGLLLNSQFVETTHSWPLAGPALELDVDVNELKAKMRFAYEHRDEVQRLGQQAAQDVQQNFTWEHTYRKMAERLEVNARLAEQRFRADAFGKLAAIVHTHDSEATIAECLARLKPFVDQILVMDGASQDRTCQIASEYGAHVLGNGDTAESHDPLAQLNCEWCFNVDGSVHLAEDDAVQLRQLVDVQPAVAKEVTVQLSDSDSNGRPMPDAIRIQRLGKRPQLK